MALSHAQVSASAPFASSFKEAQRKRLQGVDIEPDAYWDLLANVTLRRVSAIQNAGDAFDILACKGSAADCGSRPGRNVSVLLEDCRALDCPYIWGSGFKIALNSAVGSIELVNATTANMPGAGLAVYGGAVVGSGTSLVVRNLTATNVATEWEHQLAGKREVQSFYPITIGAQGLLPDRIELDGVNVHKIAAVAAGQTFVGCQNYSFDDNYFAPASCGAVGRVGALTGDVTVWAKNSSACSKSLLGGAGDKLTVSCREPPFDHQAMGLKSDDAEETAPPLRSIKVWPQPPSPKTHPLYNRSYSKGASYEIFSPLPGRRLPGWAALRVKDTDLDDLERLWLQIDKYVGNDTANGDLDCANALWPSSRIIFHDNFTRFAAQLKTRRIPIVDLGGFCPSGSSQFDANQDSAIGFWPDGAGATSYLDEGKAILGDLLLGLDMGEQDDRYMYSYALQGVLAAGSGSYFEQYRRFRDFSDEIERASGGRMASLAHLPFSAHYYHVRYPHRLAFLSRASPIF